MIVVALNPSVDVEWLRWRVATGTAATRCDAGRLPSPVLIRRLARQTRVEQEKHCWRPRIPVWEWMRRDSIRWNGLGELDHD